MQMIIGRRKDFQLAVDAFDLVGLKLRRMPVVHFPQPPPFFDYKSSSSCSPMNGAGPGRSVTVRLNLGAGEGWSTPSRSKKVPRALLCG
jgi:hypothetical protein